MTGLQLEANRQPGDGRVFAGSDIDAERTHDNVFLRKEENWNKRITAEIAAAGVHERKNSVVIITGVYTASPEFFRTHTREEMMSYFGACLDYHDREYGTCINAVIHLDETTPHMQVASIPITYDEQGAHLSARMIIGDRAKMRQRQTSFAEQVGKCYGLERGVERDPAVIRKRTEKRDWQIAEQKKKLETLKLQVEEAERNLTDKIDKSRELMDINDEHMKASNALMDRERVKVTRMAYEEQKSLMRDLKTYIDTLHDNATATASVLEEAKRLYDDASRMRNEAEDRILSAAKTLSVERERQREQEAREQREAVESIQRQYRGLIDNQKEIVSKEAHAIAERVITKERARTERLEAFIKSRGIWDDFQRKEDRLRDQTIGRSRSR